MLRRFKGYMTVEAAFIVPVVIFSIAAIIYFSLYLYTGCILAQDCYILAFRATCNDELRYEDDMGGYVMDKCDKVAGGKYFGSERPAFRAVVRGKEIEVWGSTVVRHKAIRKFVGGLESEWQIENSKTAKKREYAKHLRTVKRIKDLGSKE